MSTGLKANIDGSAAVQVGGTDYISITSAGNITMPGNLTVGGIFTAAGGTVYNLNAYQTPTVWSKPAGLKQVKVTVVGAGGAGGSIPTSPTLVSTSGGGSGGAAILVIPAPTILGPVAVTAGPGTNSFGAFCSATAGSNGSGNPSFATGGAGGVATGGTLNIDGTRGGMAAPSALLGTGVSGAGAPSILGTGGSQTLGITPSGNPGTGYGSGGGGANKPAGSAVAYAGGTGAPGIVIVEEFY